MQCYKSISYTATVHIIIFTFDHTEVCSTYSFRKFFRYLHKHTHTHAQACCLTSLRFPQPSFSSEPGWPFPPWMFILSFNQYWVFSRFFPGQRSQQEIIRSLLQWNWQTPNPQRQSNESRTYNVFTLSVVTRLLLSTTDGWFSPTTTVTDYIQVRHLPLISQFPFRHSCRLPCLSYSYS